MLGRLLCALVVVSVVLQPYALHAQTDSSDGSADSSANSNESSANSNASSDNSNQSSDNSNQSSDSNESSDTSSEDSTRESSQNSSDGSSRGQGGQTWAVIAAILILGAVSVVVFFAVRSTVKDDDDEAEATLQRFMREYHAGLVRDISISDGPVLDTLAIELGLTAPERRQLKRELASAPEQLDLLLALDGPIDGAAVREFAGAFCEVAQHTLGDARWREVVGARLGTARLLPAP